MAERNVTFDLDLADWAVLYNYTTDPVGSPGPYGYGVFATFTEAKRAAVRQVQLEVDRARQGLRIARAARKRDHEPYMGDTG